MDITSFYFLCFFVGILIIYYIIPGKLQWVFLLLCSAVYYLLADSAALILYPLFSAGVCYAGVRYIDAARNEHKKKVALITVIVLNIGILFILKYINFGIYTINDIAKLLGHKGSLLHKLKLLTPLGVSFYTFSLLGYVIDCYNGIAKAQMNPLKLALYGMYFPAVISGPILKYRECGEQFFEPHRFDYVKVTRGMQRMLWGFFKKLVIAERLDVVVDTVYKGYPEYAGAYIWVATFFYAFQLYTDFSGCMDIVLGMSESFGLILPENFNRPFFSKSISEYWRRWHITLGEWMKDYLFYPLLRSGFFTKLNKSWRKKFGKKTGKQLTTFAAMFILWFSVGVWHGGAWKYVIGSGLLHWFYIVTGELIGPPCRRLLEKLHISSENKIINFLRILRTFFLVSLGDLFFRAKDVPRALSMIRLAVSAWNPEILWNGSMLGLGLGAAELIVLALSLLLLFAVELLQAKGPVRAAVAARKLPIRWLIWYALIFGVLIFGCYGPEYSAAEFIYQGF